MGDDKETIERKGADRLFNWTYKVITPKIISLIVQSARKRC